MGAYTRHPNRGVCVCDILRFVEAEEKDFVEAFNLAEGLKVVPDQRTAGDGEEGLGGVERERSHAGALCGRAPHVLRSSRVLRRQHFTSWQDFTLLGPPCVD